LLSKRPPFLSPLSRWSASTFSSLIFSTFPFFRDARYVKGFFPHVGSCEGFLCVAALRKGHSLLFPLREMLPEIFPFPLFFFSPPFFPQDKHGGPPPSSYRKLRFPPSPPESAGRSYFFSHTGKKGRIPSLFFPFAAFGGQRLYHSAAFSPSRQMVPLAFMDPFSFSSRVSSDFSFGLSPLPLENFLGSFPLFDVRFHSPPLSPLVTRIYFPFVLSHLLFFQRGWGCFRSAIRFLFPPLPPSRADLEFPPP